jgi:hypothetical protein
MVSVTGVPAALIRSTSPSRSARVGCGARFGSAASSRSADSRPRSSDSDRRATRAMSVNSAIASAGRSSSR